MILKQHYGDGRGAGYCNEDGGNEEGYCDDDGVNTDNSETMVGACAVNGRSLYQGNATGRHIGSTVGGSCSNNGFSR